MARNRLLALGVLMLLPVAARGKAWCAEHPAEALSQEEMLANRTASVPTWLFLYDPASVEAFGGDSAVQSYILGQEDLAEEVFANSGLTGRTVHIVVRSAPADLRTDDTIDPATLWNRLASSALAAKMRTTEHASRVFLSVRRMEGASGVGRQTEVPGDLKSPFSAFAVVRTGTLFSQLTAFHEFGHSVGCTHDPAHPTPFDLGGGGGRSKYPYGHGYAKGDLCDIMGICPASVPAFSTPRVRYEGQTIGVKNVSDCARVIIANWEAAAKLADVPYTPSRSTGSKGGYLSTVPTPPSLLLEP